MKERGDEDEGEGDEEEEELVIIIIIIIVIIIIIMMMMIIHSFYIALFSALEQTRCAHWHVILNE